MALEHFFNYFVCKTYGSSIICKYGGCGCPISIKHVWSSANFCATMCAAPISASAADPMTNFKFFTYYVHWTIEYVLMGIPG